ncbi:MAG TPA: hypothetical protein VGI81_26445 [Tepidisphaeraceae bacterium]|jgi:hypothetical protein
MAQPNDEVSQPERRKTLEYAGPMSRSGLSRSSRLILWCAVAVVGAFLAFTVVAPFLNHRHPEENRRLKCELNILQIGQGIALFANEHGGKFPDDLATLFANGNLDARVFVCPLTGDTPAPAAPTTQATAAGLRQPGHCSYIYLGKGLTDQIAKADTVLLYEPISNHGGDGMHVLFGDFHVEWVPASIAQTILKQHAASTQPIRLKTGSSGS